MLRPLLMFKKPGLMGPFFVKQAGKLVKSVGNKRP